MLGYLLPSVVDICGAGIKRAVVINQKRFENKNKQSTIISNSVKIFFTFCSGDLWSWKKNVLNQKRLQQILNKAFKLSIMLTYLFPPVEDISGAGITRPLVMSKKR